MVKSKLRLLLTFLLLSIFLISSGILPAEADTSELPGTDQVISSLQVDVYFGYTYANIDYYISRQPYLCLKLIRSNGSPLNLQIQGEKFLSRDGVITSEKLYNLESVYRIEVNKDDGTLKLPGGSYSIYLPSTDGKWYSVSFTTRQVGLPGDKRSELISVNGLAYSYKRWTPPVKMTGSQYVTVGSGQYDVTRVMGKPVYIHTAINNDELMYFYGEKDEGQYIHLMEIDGSYIVVGWVNKGDLKVSLGTQLQAANPFKLGSTKREVVNANGTPNSITCSMSGVEEWKFQDHSSVVFKDDRVITWMNRGVLKVDIGRKDANSMPVTLGSSRNEVIKTMGTPTSITFGDSNNYLSESWTYGDSFVEFSDETGGVQSYYNSGNLNVNLGNRQQTAPGITVGSTKADVLMANGTPRGVSYQMPEMSYWVYGEKSLSKDASAVYFNYDGRVTSYVNWGDLKTKKILPSSIKSVVGPKTAIFKSPEKLLHKVGSKIRKINMDSYYIEHDN